MHVDLDQERRRAERYQDLSRSAFASSVIALCVITALAFIALWPRGG